MLNKKDKTLIFERILRIVGGICAWLLLLAIGFGAGLCIAHLLHLILD